FRAAFGLLQLTKVDGEIRKRQKVAERYRDALKDVPGLTMLSDLPGVQHNYAYFPVMINARKFGMTRDQLYEKLRAENIMSRRYFYPLCSEFPVYQGLPSASAANLPVATNVAREVLCLPMFAELREEEQDCVIRSLRFPRGN
ncbi:MAG: DegT/DnrJ/EryC1/StrS family aminotransferase, partial [Victivallaceae bacterium]